METRTPTRRYDMRKPSIPVGEMSSLCSPFAKMTLGPQKDSSSSHAASPLFELKRQNSFNMLRKVMQLQGRDSSLVKRNSFAGCSMSAPRTPRTPNATPGRRGPKSKVAMAEEKENMFSESSQDTDDNAGVSSYLTIEGLLNVAAKQKSSSNRTLSQLGQDIIDVANILPLVEKYDAEAASDPSRYQSGMKEHLLNFDSQFPHWMRLLYLRFTVLLHGVGSKYEVLQGFARERLKKKGASWVKLRGFQSGSLTVRQLLNAVCMAAGGHLAQSTWTSPQDQLLALQEHFNQKKVKPLFLVVHSFDAPALWYAGLQQKLFALADCRHIHMIASVDNLNTGLMWTPEMKNKLKNVWIPCHTLQRYTREERNSDDPLLFTLLGSKGAKASLASLHAVLGALNLRTKQVFRKLAEMQLKRATESAEAGEPFLGIPVSEFYSRCQEEFMINNQAAMYTHLKEFEDHAVLKTIRSSTAANHLCIQLSNSELEEYLQEDAPM